MFLIGLLSMACSFYCVIQSRPICWGWHSIPHQSSIMKRLCRLAYRQIWWVQFFNWHSLFLDYSSFCQVDKKLTNVDEWVDRLTDGWMDLSNQSVGLSALSGSIQHPQRKIHIPYNLGHQKIKFKKWCISLIQIWSVHVRSNTKIKNTE